MSDDDWTKLARKMGEVSDAPLFIDDSPEHVDDGDPGQVPPAQAAPRPQARRHRLPAADDARARRSSPASRRSRSSPVRSSCSPRSSRSRSSRSRQLNRGPEQRTDKQPDDVRPARVRLDRAGRRHGDPAAPRGRLREGVDPRRRGRPHRGQAPQRPDPRHRPSPSRATTPASSTWPTTSADAGATVVCESVIYRALLLIDRLRLGGAPQGALCGRSVRPARGAMTRLQGPACITRSLRGEEADLRRTTR